MRWGEGLECAAEVGRGDFVYFGPLVPHQEFNVDESETVDFVVIRNDPFVPGAHPPRWSPTRDGSKREGT